MKRNCSLDEISDGALYGLDDLVEASCNGCKGQATCCHGMGCSIILDPYDIYRLTTNLNITVQELLTDKIELNVVDGIILPNLKMSAMEEGCSFLNNQGKCSIHAHRPGICRIFPLGRYYENHGFQYFLQKDECQNNSKTMVKVRKWIQTSEIEKNSEFLINWHYFLNEAENVIMNIKDEKLVKDLNLYILNCFYLKKYESELDFYIQFNQRLSEANSILNLEY